MHTVISRSIYGVLQAIAFFAVNTAEHGPVLFQIKYDGCYIEATHYGDRGEKYQNPDAKTKEASLFAKMDILKPLVAALIEKDRPFVIQTGTDEDVCTILWTIVKTGTFRDVGETEIVKCPRCGKWVQTADMTWNRAPEAPAKGEPARCVFCEAGA
ncbi:MAG: hypothetical protein WC107_00890 [Patescibacteria group bacterium]